MPKHPTARHSDAPAERRVDQAVTASERRAGSTNGPVANIFVVCPPRIAAVARANALIDESPGSEQSYGQPHVDKRRREGILGTCEFLSAGSSRNLLPREQAPKRSPFVKREKRLSDLLMGVDFE